MKNIFSIIFLSLMMAATLTAQLDRSQRPQPGPAPVIQLGDFQSFKLSNGLQVIVVENHKVPVVSFQITLDVDPVLEKDVKGYVDLAGSLMREGTKSRSKQQLDEEIDFIGANLSTYSTGIYASSLKRHQEKLLGLMSDVLLNPIFPEEQLMKSITQAKSGLEANRNDANFIAGNIQNVALYGANHPYGEVQTPESLEKITVDHLKNYYNTYFKPNVAYLVVVGDITVKEAKTLAKKYFGQWKKGKVPTHVYQDPKAPEYNRIALGNRSGAIQSTVFVTYPLEFTPGNPDAIKTSVMNSVLGGGVFSGRLMQNLREDKGYTYGAGSSVSNDKLIGNFTANTEVRSIVTDSTVHEIFKEMQRLIDEPVDEESLQMVKNFMSGSFARALESPRTIANFALNVKRYNLPENYYATYLERLNAVTIADVQQMAAKYLKPKNAIIVVAGNQDEVLEKLRVFNPKGEVELYDAFGRPAEAPKAVSGEITAQSVITNYVNAIGGAQKLGEIKDVITFMTASVQGMSLDIQTKQKSPNMYYTAMSMGGNIFQEQIFNGTRGMVTSMGQKQEVTGDDLKELELQAALFPELNYDKLGYTLELTGIEKPDGKDLYRIKLTGPTGKVSSEFYCVETGLKLRSEMSQETPMGVVTIVTTYGDYQEVNGIKFPYTIKQQAGPQNFDMKVSSIQLNTGLDNSAFIIE